MVGLVVEVQELRHRFEAHRIGLEDFELLAQVKQRDPACAQAVTALVLHGFDDYRKDVTVYRSARRLLMEPSTSGSGRPCADRAAAWRNGAGDMELAARKQGGPRPSYVTSSLS